MANLDTQHSAEGTVIEHGLPTAIDDIRELYKPPSEYPALVAQWAVDTVERFKAPSGKKAKAEKSLRSISRMLSYAPLEEGGISHLTLNPGALEFAADTWGSMSDSGDQAATRLLAESSRVAREHAKEHWRDIDEETLGTLIILSAKEGHASTIATEALRGFCEAPKNLEEAIEIKYKWAHSILDLLDNPEAVMLAVKTALHQTDLMPQGGYIHQAQVAVTDGGLNLGEIHSHAIQADIVATSLGKFINLDVDKIATENKRALLRSQEFMRLAQKLASAAGVELGESEYQKRVRTIKHYTESIEPRGELKEDPLSGMSDTEIWAHNLYVASTDPLAKRYASEVAGLVAGQELARFITKRDGIEYDTMMIPLPEHGVEIDLFIQPGIDVSLYSELRQRAIAEAGEILEKQLREQELAATLGYTRKIVTQIATFNYEGAKLPIVLRPLSGIEARTLHPLQELHKVGFPLPDELEEASPEDALEGIELLKEDLQNAGRFAGRHPIRFPLSSDKYRELGYTHIDVVKSADSTGLVAFLYHEGKPYKIELDAEYEIEPGGQFLSIPGMVEALHYTILRLYDGWANDRRVRTSEGELDSETTRKVSAGHGHLAYIPLKRDGEPSQFSKDRADAFKEQQPRNYGGDLAVASAIRRAQDPQGRNSTYHEERTPKPGTPPLVVYPGRQL